MVPMKTKSFTLSGKNMKDRDLTILTGIKLLHTLIWLIFVLIIFYIVYSGMTGNITIFTWLGIGLIIAEGIVLAIFKMYCPLTVWARKYSDSQADNFDIYLPNWLANYNKVIITSIVLIGLALVLYRELT